MYENFCARAGGADESTTSLLSGREASAPPAAGSGPPTHPLVRHTHRDGIKSTFPTNSPTHATLKAHCTSPGCPSTSSSPAAEDLLQAGGERRGEIEKEDEGGRAYGETEGALLPGHNKGYNWQFSAALSLGVSLYYPTDLVRDE